jgi:hypothetical protein
MPTKRCAADEDPYAAAFPDLSFDEEVLAHLDAVEQGKSFSIPPDGLALQTLAPKCVPAPAFRDLKPEKVGTDITAAIGSQLDLSQFVITASQEVAFASLEQSSMAWPTVPPSDSNVTPSPLRRLCLAKFGPAKAQAQNSFDLPETPTPTPVVLESTSGILTLPPYEDYGLADSQRPQPQHFRNNGSTVIRKTPDMLRRVEPTNSQKRSDDDIASADYAEQRSDLLLSGPGSLAVSNAPVPVLDELAAVGFTTFSQWPGESQPSLYFSQLPKSTLW